MVLYTFTSAATLDVNSGINCEATLDVNRNVFDTIQWFVENQQGNLISMNMSSINVAITPTKRNYSVPFVLNSANLVLYGSFRFYKCCTLLSGSTVSCVSANVQGTPTSSPATTVTTVTTSAATTTTKASTTGSTMTPTVSTITSRTTQIVATSSTTSLLSTPQPIGTTTVSTSKLLLL